MVMDNSSEATWSLAFRGRAARSDAEDLQNSLRQSGVLTGSIREEPPLQGGLGPTEIILTVVAAEAAKAVISVGFQALEAFLTARLQSRPKSGTIQVVVKGKKDTLSTRKTLDLRRMTADAITTFLEGLRKAIDAQV
jgi:hypothetical protein